jgi:hypothetical protein
VHKTQGQGQDCDVKKLVSTTMWFSQDCSGTRVSVHNDLGDKGMVCTVPLTKVQ